MLTIFKNILMHIIFLPFKIIGFIIGRSDDVARLIRKIVGKSDDAARMAGKGLGKADDVARFSGNRFGKIVNKANDVPNKTFSEQYNDTVSGVEFIADQGADVLIEKVSPQDEDDEFSLLQKIFVMSIGALIMLSLCSGAIWLFITW